MPEVPYCKLSHMFGPQVRPSSVLPRHEPEPDGESRSAAPGTCDADRAAEILLYEALDREQAQAESLAAAAFGTVKGFEQPPQLIAGHAAPLVGYLDDQIILTDP